MKLPFALAKRFVAGETFKAAIPKVKELNDKGIKVSLDLLGENVKDRKTADETTSEYVDLLKGIRDMGLDSNISIKLTMIGLDIDESYCIDNLYTLLDAAKKNGQFIRLDMEGSPYTQRTIDILKKAHSEYPGHVGTVIQSMLHRTRTDIPDLAAIGADVRLCKGAYKEPSNVAIQNMPDIREAFKGYAKQLLGVTPYPRMATHDDELVRFVMDYTKEKGISKDRFEMQMLYGLRQSTCEEMAANGYNVRVYVPYGTMWVPYFTRRLRERKENVWFVVSNLFRK
jgi:proline dehydrogenase